MDTSIVALIVSAAAALSGIILGWSGKSRSFKKDVAAEAGQDASIRVDVEYIKRGVDDMRVEMRLQGQRFDTLAERVTRVEESAKQAHHRIDEIRKGAGV